MNEHSGGLVGKVVSRAAVAEDVVTGGAAEALNRIWSPGCAAAIWKREPDLAFQHWLDTLPSAELPETRLVVSPDSVRYEMEALFDRCRVPKSPYSAMLIDDIELLAGIFARVMGLVQTEMLRVRLDVISDDACQRFHIDNVSARMVCTYRGLGTQYGCGRPGEKPSSIYALETGSVGLFRGRLWPSADACGLVHRSPPISRSGETRLLLVVDHAPDAE